MCPDKPTCSPSPTTVFLPSPAQKPGSAGLHFWPFLYLFINSSEKKCGYSIPLFVDLAHSPLPVFFFFLT